VALRFALPGCSVKRAADPADVASGKVPIIAPGTIRAFDKFAIGENVVAGNAMSRRAGYAFGNLLDFGPEQFVSCGIAVGSVVGPLTVSYSRDARNFARYIDETLELWGEHAEVHYGLHTWPVSGPAEVVAFLESQRDTYKYIHDQAFRLANKGYTPLEAAEVVELPEELPRKWFNRGYHGTLHPTCAPSTPRNSECGTATRSRCPQPAAHRVRA
jgi:alkyl sulfatase BDS1-like metallo-beta-lactamase superfamily hydrolase